MLTLNLMTLAVFIHTGCGDGEMADTGDASSTPDAQDASAVEDSRYVQQFEYAAEPPPTSQSTPFAPQDTDGLSQTLESEQNRGLEGARPAPSAAPALQGRTQSMAADESRAASETGASGKGLAGNGFGGPASDSEAMSVGGMPGSQSGGQQARTGQPAPSEKPDLSKKSETPAPIRSPFRRSFNEPNAVTDEARKEGEALRQVQRPLTVDLLPGEELWVIARAVDPDAETPQRPDVPGCGALMAQLPGKTTNVPVPLKHTAVEGHIDGFVASVDVTQQFHNPYDSKIEAVYVFPLPQNAAVNEFVMTVGERKIRGIIRERQQAEQIYANARAQGHVASLLTQERPNIFTQKVANIEPGKQIDINIRYFNTLQYDDGSYEFVFPMVVGPRFNPPATTDGVAAVARGSQGTGGQSTEVSYLAPHERSGHDISLNLHIDSGVDIEDIHSVNHSISHTAVSTCQRKITLDPADTIPNRDFVLRYRVAGDQIKTSMMTHQDDRGQYFTMMIYPPADLKSVQRSPMEIVFVLDCSGSMRGQPIEQAKAAIRHALHSLTPRDTFQIIRFSNNSSQLGSEPVLATEDNVRKGIQYLNSLNGSGGTHMIEGIKAALDFPHDEGRYRLVSFMTDGFIGNEQQILTTLHAKLGASRIFSFGVGSSPNRYLMDRMAIVGRGAVAYLSLNDNAVDVMSRFNQRISHPAMTDLSIDWGEMNVTDVYPQHVPDLIVGRPVTITGRFEGRPSVVKVNGRVCMEPASFAVSLDDEATSHHAGIAAVWARMKIKDLMTHAAQAPEEAQHIQQLVTQTALDYNLMSSFTAFVAVDSLTKTEGEFGTTVAVPVPVPEGVRYDTTVGGNVE
jgi:Ca-activated chloride channel family protein